jgi:RNA polymerase sigma-70 factor (ECF subfamily)
MKNFLASDWKKQKAQKRGAGVSALSIEGELAEQRYQNEPADAETPETLFKRKWAMTLLENTMKSLGAEYVNNGKEDLFEELKDFLAKGTSSSTYAEAGARLGITEGAVKVNVFRMRKRFQAVLKDEIAQTVSSEEEVEDELRELHSVFS